MGEKVEETVKDLWENVEEIVKEGKKMLRKLKIKKV